MTAAPEAPARQPASYATLREALSERFTTGWAAREHPAPVVVELGRADVLRPPQDPDAPARHGASIHVAAGEVLVGPWGAASGPARACGHCVALRWQRLRHRSERDALEAGTGMSSAAPGAAGPVSPQLLDMVEALYDAVTLAQAARSGARSGTGDPATPDGQLQRVSRLDLHTLRVQTFPVLAEPLCPSCPHPPPPDGEGWSARSAPAPALGYRLRSPDSYPLPVEALINPVCGALGPGTWVNVTSPTTAPVAGSFFVRGSSGLNEVAWSGQANSFARSRDLGILEGLERYAGTQRRRSDPVVLASLESLGTDALDPRNCGTYAPEVYAGDPVLTAFSADREIPWVWGYSLRDERPILVPSRMCHYGLPPGPDNFVFESSNGCAIGSCLEEATLFGLLELIERDAFLLAWYGGTSLTEIDLESCGSSPVRAMVDRAALLGYGIHAYDNRIDLAVPVVTGLAVRLDGGAGALSFAAAASLDPETAVEGALSEVLTYIPHLAGLVEKRRSDLEAMTQDYSRVVDLQDHAHLFGLPSMMPEAKRYLEPAGLRSIRELYPEELAPDRRHRQGSVTGGVRRCRDELARACCDVIVVDQTTPEQERMGLSTVRTLAPGLLPIDFGWTRQRALRMPRLRTAYRRAGWRTSDLTDAELHAVPHPFP